MATAEQSVHLSDYWQRQVTAWSQSNLSQKSFCEQHELNYHRFGYWRRKFLEQAQAGADTRGSGFVAVQPAQSAPVDGLSLTLPNGIVIQGVAQSNLPLVAQLLQQL